MEPIKRGELEVHIESVTVIFPDTNESIELSTRLDSVCHFFEKFPVGEESVQLRLDWGAPDSNGNPTLDADFSNTRTEKKRNLKGARGEAHHTASEDGVGRCYSWSYKDCRRPFKVLVHWSGAISFGVGLGIRTEAEVIKSSS